MKLAPLALAALTALTTFAAPQAKATQSLYTIPDVRLECRVPGHLWRPGLPRTKPCSKTVLQIASPFTGPGTYAGHSIPRADGKGVVTVTGQCPKGFDYVTAKGPVGYRCKDNGKLNVLSYYGGTHIKAMFEMGILPPVQEDVRIGWTYDDAVAAADYRAMCRRPDANSISRCRTIVWGVGVFNTITGAFIGHLGSN